MFRWVRVLGNDACFYNRKRVIRGKGKRGEEKGGGGSRRGGVDGGNAGGGDVDS